MPRICTKKKIKRKVKWVIGIILHYKLYWNIKWQILLKSLQIILLKQNPLLVPRTIRAFHTWSLIIYFEELSPSTFIFFIVILCSLRMSNWRYCRLLLSCKSISQPNIGCEFDHLNLISLLIVRCIKILMQIVYFWQLV